MNAPFARTKLERFGKLLTEYRSREAKSEQSQRGWYDDDGVRQGGLIAFVRYFWHVLEPETPFVDGWPLWAICQHLESVTFGEITRLLITVPPGFAKSILVDVFWPAWEWGPMKKTHYRYVAFSYSATLTERDNGRFRDLIVCPEYQKMYGPLRTSVEEGVRKTEGVGLSNKTTVKVKNTHTGWKLASSVGGVGTGERGDRVICFPAETRVLTNLGWLRIGDIVANKQQVSIAGYDETCDKIAWQRVEKYEENPGAQLIEVVHDRGSFRCTADHPIYVRGRGYVAAANITAGETLRVVRDHDLRQAESPSKKEILLQDLPDQRRPRGSNRGEQSSVQSLRHDGLPASLSLGPNTPRPVLQSQMPRNICDRGWQSDVCWWSGYSAMSAVWRGVSVQSRNRSVTNALFAFMRYTGKMGQRTIAFRARAEACLRRMWKNIQTCERGSSKPSLFESLCRYFARQANSWCEQWALCAWAGAAAISAGVDWTHKAAIRTRDHNRCMVCHLPGTKPALHVHHIDYVKENLQPSNLITVCKWCHGKMHGRPAQRHAWKIRLSSLLSQLATPIEPSTFVCVPATTTSPKAF